MTFYKIQELDGRTEIQRANAIYAPGWSLTGPTDAPRDGWHWFTNEAAFRASDMALGAVEALTRTVLLDAGVTATVEMTDGEEWQRPLGAFGAYPQHATVTHMGKRWVSTLDMNVWEPGVSGWKPETGEDGPAEWIRPTGAHDAYAKDDQVTFGGAVWISDMDGNVWSPGVYGWTRKP